MADPGSFSGLSRLQRYQKIAVIIVGIAVMVIGSLGGLTILFSFNFLSSILCWYMMIFGFIAVMGELNFRFILNRFQFMESYFGRGIFYVFVGTLGVTFKRNGNSIIIFIGGCIMVAAGFSSLLMALVGQKTGLQEARERREMAAAAKAAKKAAKAGGYGSAGSAGAPGYGF